MSVKVLIPTALRPYSNNADSVDLPGDNVDQVLGNLVSTYPDLKKHLFTEDGKVRNFVNVYVNDDDVRYLDNGDSKVGPGDVISIVPSVAGGSFGIFDQTPDVEFSKAEYERYSRHLIMPEVALEGQKKLKASSVLLIGMGGLGSPLGMYLAAAGVGKLGLLDFDTVDFTNLQRQVMYSTDDVGKPKAEASAARLQGINPFLEIEIHKTRLSSDNAMELFKDYDIIIDGTDNFPTRYLVNDACVLLGKPNVYGSIFRFEGQVTVFHAQEGPCYRCLYPEPPPPGLVPSCAEGGVLGILPGVVGLMQATEAVKLICGIGEPLIGRLVLYDALAMQFKELKLRKDPNCPVCGENPTVKGLIDYEEFCGLGLPEAQKVTQDQYEITVAELDEKLRTNGGTYILDVREPYEYDICKLPDSNLIPLNELSQRVHELDRNQDMVVLCRTGIRSAKAVKFLQEAGFERIKNLKGGIMAWADEIDPSLPKY
jgi:adenylyltransferase/sulfurtransferase